MKKVNLKDLFGQTVLHWAAQCGSYNVARHLLICTGVNPNTKDNEKWSPLRLARASVENGIDGGVVQCLKNKTFLLFNAINREDTQTVEKILQEKSKANKLLPTQSGFFIGNTNYDEYYFEDIENTIKIILKCLKLPNDWEFEYSSSW